jgi:predicted acyl esterase
MAWIEFRRFGWKFAGPSTSKKSVQPVLLHLCANTGALQKEPVASEGKVQYRSTDRHGNGVFSYRFEQAVELIGSMRLKLWVSPSEGDDLDLFVVLRKFDCSGNEVYFSGFNGYERDGVAQGWLRASHRELDLAHSTPLRPWHSHTRVQKLGRGEIVPVEIEIWPSATLFEAGSMLQLTVQGRDAAKYPAFRHQKLVNRGWHTIFTGGQFDSHLAVPLNRSEGTEIPLAQKEL